MEFEIAGNTYRAGKMDTFKQFHVGRRLAPVLGGLAQAAGGESEGSAEDAEASFAKFLQPIADAVAQMPDADCDFILQSCLGVVQIQQGTSWANVMAVGSKTLLFDAIDLGTMLQITAKVIQENLGGFFQGGIGKLNPPAPTAQA